MTPAQAEVFMTQKSALSAGTAKGEITGTARCRRRLPSYLTGCLEIEQLRANGPASCAISTTRWPAPAAYRSGWPGELLAGDS